ncbi:hypothetical protein [Stenotrophomonas sp. MMGLT7]|uniref:hypothetical protein n=1 Tax=Stenotrophomonas sp. MMGLT7 TaxID=2901227 RepID=UPI001E3A55B7|nr:hypothetical protein [Stenotrophomonas sp. MMGLT7]MCD7097562.1 hypothetical protein [Stenotrophomonas sp. MMGLT7]
MQIPALSPLLARQAEAHVVWDLSRRDEARALLASGTYPHVERKRFAARAAEENSYNVPNMLPMALHAQAVGKSRRWIAHVDSRQSARGRSAGDTGLAEQGLAV